jgi:hypothetical protein
MARAVKSVGHFPQPRRSLSGARLAFWPLPSDKPLHPFTFYNPPNPLTPAIRAYQYIARNTRAQQLSTRSSNRRQIRATPDPHRAHDYAMKYFQQTVDFDYSWEEVSTSNWRKYGPWNEKTPHVIAVDTLSRSVDPATGIVSSGSFTCYHCHRDALQH